MVYFASQRPVTKCGPCPCQLLYRPPVDSVTEKRCNGTTWKIMVRRRFRRHVAVTVGSGDSRAFDRIDQPGPSVPGLQPGALLGLQLGALLSHPAVHRAAAEPEPAVRGCTQRGSITSSIRPARAPIPHRSASGLRSRCTISTSADPRRADQSSCCGGQPGRSGFALITMRTLAADPFNPFLLADLRPVAYMKSTVMSYLDNLIAWADNLFCSHSREALSEATLLYVIAMRSWDRSAAVTPPQHADRVLRPARAEARCLRQRDGGDREL